jgi:hypothetical protein
MGQVRKRRAEVKLGGSGRRLEGCSRGGDADGIIGDGRGVVFSLKVSSGNHFVES